MILLFSCQREIKEENFFSDNKILKAKKWFDSYITTFQPDKMFQNAIYRWDKAKLNKAKNGYETIVVPIRVDKVNPGYLGMRSLVLYPWKNGNGYYVNVMETIFDREYFAQSKQKYNIFNFTGIINSWSLKSGFLRGGYFHKGEMTGIVDLSVANKELILNNRTNTPIVPCGNCLPNVTVYANYSSAISAYVYQIQLTINNIYASTYVLQGGNIGANPCEYTGCTESQNVTELLDANFWDNFWAEYWTSVEQDYYNQWMLHNLKDSTGNPCFASALNTLKSIESKLPKTINDFFGEFPEFFEIFKSEFVDTLPGWSEYPKPARTESSIGNNIHTTYINSFYHHMTDLGYAANMLHEALHCMIVSKFNYAQGDTAALRALAEEYGYRYTGLFLGTLLEQIARDNDMQHILMMDRYKNVFATALYQFAVAKGISVTLDYCMDLAYWGAYDSQAFIDLPSSDKERIRSRVLAEQDPSGNSAPLIGLPSISAKGTPCP